jgi:uncharacterized membrane protein YfcA
MTPDLEFIFLVCSFFVIALVYSSVGFGGGSSYLAILAVMGVGFEIIRPAALLCNIVVVSGGTYIFWKEGNLDFKKTLPFIFASIPLAFLGGYWKITESNFFILLGICLLLASILLWIQPVRRREEGYKNPFLNAALGGGIGFLSGLVSIGGGIFLSPVLHLLNWDEPKKISALASLFIFVNSISGLAGQASRHQVFDWSFILPLLLAVFIGGQFGSRLGARTFNPLYIKRVTALVIMVAAITILKQNL